MKQITKAKKEVLFMENKMTIKDYGCVDKSFVGFYDELAQISESHTES